MPGCIGRSKFQVRISRGQKNNERHNSISDHYPLNTATVMARGWGYVNDLHVILYLMERVTVILSVFLPLFTVLSSISAYNGIQVCISEYRKASKATERHPEQQNGTHNGDNGTQSHWDAKTLFHSLTTSMAAPLRASIISPRNKTFDTVEGQLNLSSTTRALAQIFA